MPQGRRPATAPVHWFKVLGADAERTQRAYGELFGWKLNDAGFPRYVTSRTAEQLDTFAMAMLAAIGELPDTIMDRAVVIRMRRRTPGEQVDPYRTWSCPASVGTVVRPRVLLGRAAARSRQGWCGRGWSGGVGGCRRSR
jgi:hypothetical protein